MALDLVWHVSGGWTLTHERGNRATTLWQQENVPLSGDSPAEHLGGCVVNSLAEHLGGRVASGAIRDLSRFLSRMATWFYLWSYGLSLFLTNGCRHCPSRDGRSTNSALTRKRWIHTSLWQLWSECLTPRVSRGISNAPHMPPDSEPSGLKPHTDHSPGTPPGLHNGAGPCGIVHHLINVAMWHHWSHQPPCQPVLGALQYGLQVSSFSRFHVSWQVGCQCGATSWWSRIYHWEPDSTWFNQDQTEKAKHWKRTNNSRKPHSKWTSLGIRCTTMADPNTMLRIAMSFILYKAGPNVSVQGISDGVACHSFLVRVWNLVLVWFKVACRNVFLRIVPWRQTTSPHNQFPTRILRQKAEDHQGSSCQHFVQEDFCRQLHFSTPYAWFSSRGAAISDNITRNPDVRMFPSTSLPVLSAFDQAPPDQKTPQCVPGSVP